MLARGERWHYSNLAYGLLGELVARLDGGSYATTLQERVLEPLGLARTTLTPSAPAARGYLVDPYADRVHPEPDVAMTEATAALGQLWSTTGDLVRWGAFLAEGRDGVLPPGVLDEMSRLQALVDHERWTVGWGLGLGLYRRGDRVFAGHAGAMPGFLASLVVQRRERTGAVVLAGSSAGVPVETIGLDLAELALDALPRSPEPWQTGEAVPPEAEPLLGRWWTEGNELVVSYLGGRLQAELVGGPEGRRVSYFAGAGDDAWRCVEGREHGELLRVARDGSGAVEKLYFATYPLTRAPATFGESA